MFGNIADRLSQCQPWQWMAMLTLLIMPSAVLCIKASAWTGLAFLVLYHCLVMVLFSAFNQILAQVRGAAKQLSEGDLTTRIPLENNKRLSLFQAVNRIGEDISRTIQALRKSTAKLLEVAEAVQKDSELSQNGAIEQKQRCR